MNVLVLCHGNINRSALAGAVLRHHGSGLAVKSAGFVNPGRRAAKKMRDAASSHGYSLEDHRSQLVDRAMMLWADLVVYMDGGNYKRMQKMLNGRMLDITVAPLGQWASPRVERIPDPAWMARGSKEFASTVELIVAATRNLADELIA